MIEPKEMSKPEEDHNPYMHQVGDICAARSYELVTGAGATSYEMERVGDHIKITTRIILTGKFEEFINSKLGRPFKELYNQNKDTDNA